MDCDSFQFLNQDYAKILHKNDYFFPSDPKNGLGKIYIYTFFQTAFLLVYLNFDLYKNTGYFM